jgi:hypothetical protein
MIGNAYKWLWEHTPTGLFKVRLPYTYRMRRQPWLLLIPAASVVWASTRKWGVWPLLIGIGIGFVFGHVFW